MEGETLKGHLDMIVLAAVEAAPAHGYAIIDEIRRRSGGAFDLPEGTVYPVLHRLEASQLLSSHWEKSPIGRRRRVYALTKRGKASMVERRTSWVQFSSAVNGLLAEPRPCRT
ncbi:PadR family transcriptional regulator [Bradyrhizobium sp. LTSP885]|uniref:PadR family transcriptional regulator n=1 Tax=Bradyrhizobium sp. LTSP885 TaxID=1619232 RepID=UPI0005CAABC6|nr:helix-turn-helix transcriptional regulator [Bradyrhizobium sp. LTSP885]KJC44042.1 PadR family transcriptional regulator [Bradyrhizobium sp. LTSP885]